MNPPKPEPHGGGHLEFQNSGPAAFIVCSTYGQIELVSGKEATFSLSYIAF